jgi:hypothetical protein
MAIARCAERGAQVLWECIEGDYDGGRVDGSILVSLSMPHVVRRLPRLFECIRSGTGLRIQPEILRSAQHHGVPVPPDVETAPNPERLAVATLEDRRAAWPKERDELILDEEFGRHTLSDEQAHALCRKFQPTESEMRKVLDWAVARPDGDKLRWLFLLCTDYQLAKEYRPWNNVADIVAAIDVAPLRELAPHVHRAAEQLGIAETEAFLAELEYENGWPKGQSTSARVIGRVCAPGIKLAGRARSAATSRGDSPDPRRDHRRERLFDLLMTFSSPSRPCWSRISLWKKKWFPVFSESNDWWIQELAKEGRRHGQKINFYSAWGTARTPLSQP